MIGNMFVTSLFTSDSSSKRLAIMSIQNKRVTIRARLKLPVTAVSKFENLYALATPAPPSRVDPIEFPTRVALAS